MLTDCLISSVFRDYGAQDPEYDDGPGLEYGRPVIFDNGEVIEGMRYAKRP